MKLTLPILLLRSIAIFMYQALRNDLVRITYYAHRWQISWLLAGLAGLIYLRLKSFVQKRFTSTNWLACHYFFTSKQNILNELQKFTTSKTAFSTLYFWRQWCFEKQWIFYSSWLVVSSSESWPKTPSFTLAKNSEASSSSGLAVWTAERTS